MLSPSLLFLLSSFLMSPPFLSGASLSSCHILISSTFLSSSFPFLISLLSTPPLFPSYFFHPLSPLLLPVPKSTVFFKIFPQLLITFLPSLHHLSVSNKIYSFLSLSFCCSPLLTCVMSLLPHQEAPPAELKPGFLPAGERPQHGVRVGRHRRGVRAGAGPRWLPVHGVRLPGDLRLRGHHPLNRLPSSSTWPAIGQL